MRHQLTDEQFLAYLDAESNSQAQELYVAAIGHLAAIGQALGSKNSMKSFHRSVMPRKEGVSPGDSLGMATLRQRIQAAVASGEMK